MAVVKPLTLKQQAEMVAKGIVSPQTAGFQAQANAFQDMATRSQLAAQGIGESIAKASADLPNRLQSGYNTAGQEMAGFIAPLQGTVGDLTRDSLAATNARITEGNAPVTSALGQDAIGGMTYMGAARPALDFGRQGAYAKEAAEWMNAAIPQAWGSTALSQLHQYDPQIQQLLAQKQAAEGTLGAETQKAWLALRDDQRQQASLGIQQAAERMQEKQANRAWLNTLFNRADVKTQSTGSLHIVRRKPNGEYYIKNTGKTAAGSTAAKVVSDAQQAAAKLRYDAAQDKISNALDLSKLGISQQNADTAARREAAYTAYQDWKRKHPGKTKGSGVGGMSDAEVRQYATQAAQTARAAYHGVRNPNYVKGGAKDANGNIVPGTANMYTVKPQDAAEVMRTLMSANVPFSLIRRAVYSYAAEPGSWWAPALKWFPKYTAKRKPRESPGGPSK